MSIEDWDVNQPLPWDHLAGPLPKATLQKHRDSALVGDGGK
jgi:hypothetical protein